MYKIKSTNIIDTKRISDSNIIAYKYLLQLLLIVNIIFSYLIDI